MQKQQRTKTHRTGYDGSGFEFYFVQCPDRKAFEKTIKATHPEATLDDVREISGYTVCTREELLRGLVDKAAPQSPTASGDFLVTTFIIILADKDDRETLRRWYHEIGHAVDFCAQHMAIVRRDHRVKAEGQCSDEETRALLNEFLMDSLGCFISNSDEEHGISGLPSAMPWMKEVRNG